MLKTCLGCGASYAWNLAQRPHDEVTNYLESGHDVTIIDAMSTDATGTQAISGAASS